MTIHSDTMAALDAAEGAIVRLISSIEQHHATSQCDCKATHAAAHREFPALSKVRAALAAYRVETTDTQKAAHAYAQANLCDDDIEVDSSFGPTDFSDSDEGTWVRAWLWVSNSDIEEHATNAN